MSKYESETIHIMAFSLLNFTLAVQEAIANGYRVDTCSEGSPRTWINRFECHMTKRQKEQDDELVEQNATWAITPVVINTPVVEKRAVERGMLSSQTTEKRGPGRPSNKESK